MERITKRIGEKYACYAICEKECPDGIYADNAACMCTASKMAMKRLLEYEDTGLMPEQIVEQTNAGWIPVEERLPEDYSQVIVSMYDLGWITIGTYSSHSKLWKVNSYITGLGVDVRAWCPLPDPYRPVM